MPEIKPLLTNKFYIEGYYGTRRPTYPPYDRLENIARRLETTLHDLTYRLGESLLFFVYQNSNVYQIRRPLGLAFVIYFWWLGELLLLYI